MDIKKVIEELEEAREYGSDSTPWLNKVLDNAIQTIRELQSKEDEVCEWKFEEQIRYARSKCGFGFDAQRIRLDTFNYCPYCGRKIKVVE